MTDLITKHFGKKDIRIIDQDGNPWFVAKDITDILGLPDAAQATRYLDDDEKVTLSIKQDGTKRPTKQVVVNESGLYSLILKSRKPEAKAFKKWVTSEVLPSIRKTGQYKADWTDERIKSKAVRNRFTSMLKQHGYKSPDEYKATTNSMKKKLGIKSNKKKDAFDIIELCKVQAAENLATINILQSEANGYQAIKPLCDSSALMVQIATNHGKRIEVTE